MTHRARTAAIALAFVASVTLLGACGGRPDGGNPGNPSGDTTTTVATGAGG